MGTDKKEIECLARLDELASSNTSILDFLLEEELITRAERKGMLATSDVPKTIQIWLSEARGKKLQLLEYEWQVLPEERVKVFMVTDRNQREFSWGYL